MEPNVLEVTKGRVIKVWWCLAWRFYLYGAVVACLLGLSSGLLSANISEATVVICEGLKVVIMVVALILISIVVVKTVLRKKFSDFEIALVARDRQEPKFEQTE